MRGGLEEPPQLRFNKNPTEALILHNSWELFLAYEYFAR